MEHNEQARNGFADPSLQKKGKEMVDSAREKISGTANRYAEKAEDTMHQIVDRASDSANSAISSVGQKMSDFAGNLRKSSPEDGKIGAAACAVADTLDSTGSYLASHDLQSIEKDAVRLVKKYPLYSLGAGIIAGAFIGRLFSRR